MRWRRLVFIPLLISLLAGMMFSEAHAQRAVAFFENLKHTDGQWAGKPFTLLPWEKQIIRDVYGTLNPDGTRQYRYVYLEIPKKNGKSELAAGAALYHTFADGEIKGEIYGCAVDRSQAGIVYEVARDMIELVPALAKRARVTDSLKMIKDRVTGSKYKVMSADAFRKHGYKPSAVVFDELHAQPSRALWDVMTFEAGASRRQPIWWIISTAGDDPDRVSICWEQHEYAQRILAGDIVDPTWYVRIYNYEGEDIWNEANWFLANPSLGLAKSLDSMRSAAVTAKQKPANERLFRWLDLNQWLTTKLTTWLPIDLFDQTIGSWNRADLLGKDCFLGWDLSATTDLTSLCVLFPPQGAQFDWRCFWHLWIPEAAMEERVKNDHVPYDLWVKQGAITATPGDVVDYTEVEKTFLDINRFYNVVEAPGDMAFAAMLSQRLMQQGLKVVDIPQTFKVLTGPINLVEILFKIAAKKLSSTDTEVKKATAALGDGAFRLMLAGLTHENNPAVRWTFGNASIAKNGNGEIKLVKEHKGKSVDRTKRIDPMVALVNAMARAQFYKSSASVYENHGIRTL